MPPPSVFSRVLLSACVRSDRVSPAPCYFCPVCLPLFADVNLVMDPWVLSDCWVLFGQSVMLVTKEVEFGTYQETLLEMQDVVQVHTALPGVSFRVVRLVLSGCWCPLHGAGVGRCWSLRRRRFVVLLFFDFLFFRSCSP